MAFANIAGRAGFVLELDKSQLDSGLPEAERQFTRSVDRMAASAQKMTASGQYTPKQVNLAQKYGLADLIAGNDELEAQLAKTNAQLATMEAGATGSAAANTSLGGSMAGAAAKAGLLAFGITATYQASQSLQRGLQTSGAEAFTFEGRIRNIGSALMSADLVEGFEALTRQPKTLQELGISAQEAAGRLDALRQVATGQAAALREQASQVENNKDLLQEYDDIVTAAGTSSMTLAQQLLDEGRAWNQLAADTRTALNAYLAFRDAQGNVIIPGGFAGNRPAAPIVPPGASILGPGAVPDRTPPEPPRSIPSRLNERLQRARREGDLQTELQIAKEIERYYEMRLGLVKREGKLMEARRADLEQARNARDSVEDRIAADAKAAADKRSGDAKTAADQAARDYRERLAAREQNLRNAYQAALSTPGLRDDQKRFAALRNFFLAEVRDPRLEPGERASYRGELLTLKEQRKKDLEAAVEAANQETRDHLSAQEQVLKNRVAAAELTEKNKKDDLKALRAIRDFYKRSAKDEKDIYTDIEQHQFEADRIATQKKINEVLKRTSLSGADAGPMLRDFMNFQHQFLTSMISQFVGGTGAGNALQTHALEQFTIQGNRERAEQTGLLRAIANRGGRRELDEALMS